MWYLDTEQIIAVEGPHLFIPPTNLGSRFDESQHDC